MSHLVIRDASPADETRWRALWAGYLAFYQTDIAPDVTDSVWRRVFDPSSALFMRVAEVDGQIEGFALCHTHEATWTTSRDCYLEDLYLDEKLRGKGIGKALMDDLVELCRKNGWKRFYWHTQTTNATARKLYDQYVKWDGHIRYRIQVV